MRIAFKMKLHNGKAAEYKSRHDAIWPELKSLLSETGVSDYSIFIDESTHDLIGLLNISDQVKLDAMSQDPVMQRWWTYMSDIMDTNKDHSPVVVPLKEIFHLS